MVEHDVLESDQLSEERRESISRPWLWRSVRDGKYLRVNGSWLACFRSSQEAVGSPGNSKPALDATGREFMRVLTP